MATAAGLLLLLTTPTVLALPRAALVATGEVDAAQIAAARQRLGTRFQLLDDDRARLLVTPDDALPSAAARLRAALATARDRLRSFDLAAVRAALATANEAALALEPSDAARALTTELLLAEAEVALLASGEEVARAAMQAALAVSPSLTLDADRHAPPLHALLARVRLQREAGRPVELRLTSTPPEARVFAEGAWRGVTPLVLGGLHRGAQWLWLVRDGFRPRAVRIPASRFAHGSAEVAIALDALPESETWLRLLLSFRHAPAGLQPEQASALAQALGVNTIVALAGERVTLHPEPRPAEEPAVAATLPAPAASVRSAAPPPAAVVQRSKKHWYQRAWVWGLAGGLAAAAIAGGVAGYYAMPVNMHITCCTAK